MAPEFCQKVRLYRNNEMASPEMECKVFEPVGSLGNDFVRGFIPKVVRGSELDHDRSLRSGHIR
jgi:hypothetical protein